jgi:predicted adenine nucleotide alpha hydrolase (AANH) superfamily ATPase
MHTCCAPCLLYPRERLQEQGVAIKGFFYNPNIHPFAEYLKRREAVTELTESLGMECVYPSYKPEEFFHAVQGREKDPSRCSLCWALRLEKTAQEAKKHGCTHFSTTLLVSPYQNQETLKRIGNDIALKEGVFFYYEDFRTGFRKAHDQAKARGIYCQRYCGCIYSEIERSEKRHP